ncbi:MAG TPA: glutamyl-tRNA reductase [Candidatus Paceibacterota bacterium]|nr:glutamyl-tRNA reductase [Verrucomicrobiota bacterium]HSA09882.1 glutamyl-tRNA reductase [Candidatus Paceibacterota bacterium]
MKLFLAGLSYRTAPVELREKLAVHPSRLRCSGCRLKVGGNLDELVLLSTCNRVEIYGVAEKVNGNIQRLFEQFSTGEADLAAHLYVKEGAEAIEHLFSVASGLDSMVLGETEITGQVKQAYLAAQAAKLTGRVTNRLFQTALQAAKEIRTQTGIGRGATSVGSVAVELAERIFDRDLATRTVMILGAGKMGEACVRHLAKKGARSILVSNRSYDRALNLAAEFGGRAVRFDDCLPAMAAADIVVSSTGSPQTILHREEVARVMARRRDRPLFLIDIAVPRDIAPDVEQLDSVYLYNVDHLEAIVRENVRQREQELARCRAIISERTAALMARLTPAPAKDGAARQQSPPDWAFNGVAVCAG